jgi:putative flavoprotein involved in K+ transport
MAEQQQLEQIDTVIVGGGQSGLAISYLLTQHGCDHIILEESDQVGNSWQNRWESFTLVTPNWQLQLPGHKYKGDDPDGFLSRDEIIDYLQDYADLFDPPMHCGVTVTSVEPKEAGEGYLIDTSDKRYEANNVVVATGTFQQPSIPDFSERAPDRIRQLHSSDYYNPDDLADGAVLVVGSGQSGTQIAQELNENGRQVYLCISNPGRIPRRYRGEDGMWWAVKLGITKQTVDDLDAPEERFAPNPPISGKDGGQTINLHEFARDDIQLLGHLRDFQGDCAILAADMHETLARLDESEAKFRQGVDQYVEKAGLDVPQETVAQPTDGFEQEEVTQLNLKEAGVSTIIWATGFDYDYSLVNLPVFDEFDYPIQERGITEYEGLYFLGLHYLYTLESGLFLGVGEDAAHVADHIAGRS